MNKVNRYFLVAFIAAVLSHLLTPIVAQAQGPFKDRSAELQNLVSQAQGKGGGAPPAAATPPPPRGGGGSATRYKAPSCPEEQQLKDDKGKVVDCCEYGKVTESGKERCLSLPELIAQKSKEASEAAIAEYEKKQKGQVDAAIEEGKAKWGWIWFLFYAVLLGAGVAANFYFDSKRKGELKTDINRVGKTAKSALDTATENDQRLDTLENDVDALAGKPPRHGGGPPNQP